MSIRSNAATYGNSWQQRGERLPVTTKAALRKVGAVAKGIAEQMSSGTVITGPGFRPYSRRAGFPVGPEYPAVVNQRTGQYRQGWYTTERFTTGNVSGQAFTISLRNRADEARWLTARGTAVMVGRPILEAVKAKTRETLNAESRLALERAIAPAIRPEGLQGGTGNAGSALTSLTGGFGAGFAFGLGLGG